MKTFSHAMVTGGAGFIGSHLADYLVKKDIEVTIIDNFVLGKKQNIDHLARLPEVEVVNSDVTKCDLIKGYFKEADIVFHLAALVGVKLATKHPLKVLEQNLSGARNVLEASLEGGVRKVVFASSSEVYGDTTIVPMHEELPLSPISPYGISKIVGETYCRLYHREYGIQTSIVRYFNVYGPRQNVDDRSWVIPSFMTAACEGRPTIIHGSGKQTRDFTYVSDAVQGTYLVATKSDGNGDVYNIGSQRETSIKELAKLVIELSRKKVNMLHTRQRKFHIRRRCADISKASQKLGYTPIVKLKDGLRMTFNHYAQLPKSQN